MRRRAYQEGCCWSESLHPKVNLPEPDGWGWTRNNQEAWHMSWRGPESSTVCRVKVLNQVQCAENFYLVAAQKV